MKKQSTFKKYYYLTKPGIIRGNAITAAAGFLLASKNEFHLGTFVAMLIGISLVIASACVLNNYIDRKIDAKMERTKKRALVSGSISVQDAIIFASILGFGGLVSLSFTNLLAICLALIGVIFYVVFYGIAKRKTVHGTLVGSVSGAIPISVGYCAASGAFDIGAILLFLVLVFWQMPHFYAIAIYRKKDYQAAGIPVHPIEKGNHSTKVQIVLYIIAFIIASYTLMVFGYTGYAYLLVMALLGVWWLRMAVQGFSAKNDERWAEKVFGFSMIVLLAFSIMIAVEVLLP